LNFVFAGNKYAAATALRNIPKGFYHSAQRCRDEGTATLGGELQVETTLKALNHTTMVVVQPHFGSWG
jgi:hypothetical protein